MSLEQILYLIIFFAITIILTGLIVNALGHSDREKNNFIDKLKKGAITWKDIENNNHRFQKDREPINLAIEYLERKKIPNPKEVNRKKKELLKDIVKDLTNTYDPDYDPQNSSKLYVLQKLIGTKVIKRCSNCNHIGFRIWNLNSKLLEVKCTNCQEIQIHKKMKFVNNKISLEKFIELLDKDILQKPENDMSDTSFPKYAAYKILSFNIK